MVQAVGFLAREREHLLRARREITHGFIAHIVFILLRVGRFVQWQPEKTDAGKNYFSKGKTESAGRSTKCNKFPSPSAKNKTLPPPAAGPDFFDKFYAARFQFRFRRVQRRHAQREMAETGELVVRRVRQRFFRHVNLKPDVAK